MNISLDKNIMKLLEGLR